MTALRLHLIRHGGTAWSISGQHTGRTDIPLTSRGEHEARTLAPLLQGHEFTHVLTSPSRRARRTCELALPGRVAEVEPDLVEWDYGDYEGMRSADIRSARPGWNLFRDGCPHGESSGDVTRRADLLVARLVSLDGDVALFSHGQFGCALAARWIGLPLIEAQHLQLDTASLSVLGRAAHHPDVPVIESWNLTATLRIDPAGRARVRRARTDEDRAIARWENEGGEPS